MSLPVYNKLRVVLANENELCIAESQSLWDAVTAMLYVTVWTVHGLGPNDPWSTLKADGPCVCMKVVTFATASGSAPGDPVREERSLYLSWDRQSTQDVSRQRRAEES